MNKLAVLKFLSRKGLGEFFGVTALGGALTAFLSWPLITKLSVFYKDDGDFPLNGWILWYNQWAIKTGRIFHQHDYFNSSQIYPLPYTLAYSDHQFVPSLFFSPLYWLTHRLVFSVNCFSLLTFVLSFLAAYYTINYFVENKAASVLGAIIYTFNPITFSSFPDHLQLMNKYFLPPMFLFAYLYFKDPKWKNAVLFFLFFSLNALSSIYLFVFSIILLPLFFIPFLTFNLAHGNKVYFLSFLKCALVSFLFLPILFYFNAPYLDFSNKEGAVRTLDLQRHFSARLIDWISPDKTSLLYGKLAQCLEKMKSTTPFLPNQERTLFLNLLPFLLAGCGIYALKKFSFVFWPFITLLAASFLLSFGPYFLGWNANYGRIKLPFYYLYKLSPLLDGIRSPTRFQYVFYLPFALFAAYAAACFFENHKKSARALFGFFFMILILENYAIRMYDERSSILTQFTETKRNSLSFLKGEKTFHLPTFTPEGETNGFYREAQYLNWATQTEEKTLNGYSGYFPEDWVELLNTMQGELDDIVLKKLKALGIDFIILHKDLIPQERFSSWMENQGLLYKPLLVYEDDRLLILSLKTYAPTLTPCNFERDILKKDFALYSIDGQPAYYQVKLENTKDCYLSTQGEARYYQVNIDVNTKRYRSFLKLPLLIEPYQKTTAVGFINKVKTDENVMQNAKIIQ